MYLIMLAAFSFLLTADPHPLPKPAKTNAQASNIVAKTFDIFLSPNIKPKVRQTAAEDLARVAALINVSAERLAIALKDPSPAVRLQAAHILAEVGPSGFPAVPQLTQAVTRDPNSEVRAMAASALGYMRGFADDAVPALAGALKDDVVTVRRKAASALSMIGRGAKPAIPALIGALNDPDLGSRFEARVKDSAAIALGNIGPSAKGAVPALLAAAELNDMKVVALGAVAKIDPKEKALLPMLIRILRDESSLRFWQGSAMALRSMRADAKLAVPELLTLLKKRGPTADSGDLPMLCEVVAALAQIADDRAIPGLREAMTYPSKIVQEAAARALKQIEKAR